MNRRIFSAVTGIPVVCKGSQNGMASCMIEDLYSTTDSNRKATLHQYLVQPDPVIINPLFQWDAFNPGILSGLLLLQMLARRSDALGKVIEAEARDIFYGENEFLVWWDGLYDFLHPPWSGTDHKSDIGRMVRKIVVRYDMRAMNTKLRHLSTELEHLFKLTRPRRVAVEIQGSGTAEGSDIATQAVIQDISGIVKALLDHFGDIFTIQKAIGGWVLLNATEFSCLRSYWDSPSESAREAASRSQATFEEIMQLQVERWIRGQSMRDPGLQIPTHEGGQAYLSADLGGYPESYSKG
ncbi:hypothetical protein O9K51_11393 [Purpureocillium lavendulum]|uniref:Uncharacterized protein n=1 Tax=Purpureocillium lavendulum TaxID=1247861 RepID=A0AB34FCD2_9HYPO|nr:hypothetical protein O9K51_11393 [Purpureocillium lavendulum]